MKLILSKSAVKFLKKIPAKDSQKVKDKIHRLLYLAVEIDWFYRTYHANNRLKPH
jgi:mRNA-degrading endonuclease RelE of RelBE toxin-antitoxin system